MGFYAKRHVLPEMDRALFIRRRDAALLAAKLHASVLSRNDKLDIPFIYAGSAATFI